MREWTLSVQWRWIKEKQQQVKYLLCLQRRSRLDSYVCVCACVRAQRKAVFVAMYGSKDELSHLWWVPGGHTD